MNVHWPHHSVCITVMNNATSWSLDLFSESFVGLMVFFGFVFWLHISWSWQTLGSHPSRTQKIWCWLTDQIISDCCNEVTQTAAAARVRLRKYPSYCGNRTSFFLPITLCYRSCISLSVIFHSQKWLYVHKLFGRDYSVCEKVTTPSTEYFFNPKEREGYYCINEAGIP